MHLVERWDELSVLIGSLFTFLNADAMSEERNRDLWSFDTNAKKV